MGEHTSRGRCSNNQSKTKTTNPRIIKTTQPGPMQLGRERSTVETNHADQSEKTGEDQFERSLRHSAGNAGCNLAAN
jgi:hypothetical protein